jgi:hypothetical protein
MQVGDPEEEIEKSRKQAFAAWSVRSAGTISAHMMIDAALYVLTAWGASSQTHFRMIIFLPASPRAGIFFAVTVSSVPSVLLQEAPAELSAPELQCAHCSHASW